MTIYQPKTSTFEAVQWLCTNYEEVIAFTNGNVALSADGSCVIVNGETVCDNDWILKFTGQEHSEGPIVNKYGVCTNLTFAESYDVYQGLPSE